jgi:hypothetical protein
MARTSMEKGLVEVHDLQELGRVSRVVDLELQTELLPGDDPVRDLQGQFDAFCLLGEQPGGGAEKGER